MRDSRKISIVTHSQNAFHVMQELRERQELCDIRLCVDCREFYAHKVVLAGSSPYLRAMFTNGMLESEKSEVELHGIDSSTMEIIIDFMYCGSLEITIDNVQTLLQGASLLNMAGLRNACSQFLQSHIEVSNCIGIQVFADIYSVVELEASARRYLEQHFPEVSRSEEFCQLTADRLVEVLQSEQIQVEKEEQMFEALMFWIQWDPIQRASDICHILPYVKLAHLELSYLEEVVLQTDIIRSCHKCQNIVALARRIKMDNNALASIRPRAQPQCIFVVGGRTSIDSQLKSMERYDVMRDQWIPAGNMNIARTAVGSVTYDGKIYAIGGECAVPLSNEDTQYLRTIECYDVLLKQWHQKRDMKVPRSFVAVASLGGDIYALGGETRACSFDIVERYSPSIDSWTFIPSMKKKRSGAGAAVCEGKIYVAGGYDKTFHTDRASVECFDPETNEWSFIAEMSKARSGLALVSIEHYLFAMGGRCRHTDRYYDVVERYNTVTHQWTTLSPMNSPRAWPAATVYEGQIYVLGGFDGFNRLRSGEVYDPDLDTWAFISDMNISRAGGGAAVA